MKSLAFIAALITSFTIGTTAMAATTGTLNISGTVGDLNDIQVSALAAATSLNIVAGETGKSVASVQETSNHLTGYTISMSSANNGYLVNESLSSAKTTYKVKYDGASTAVALTNTAASVKSSGALSAKTVHNSDLTVVVDALPTAVTGVYSDTITVAITSAN